MTTLLKHLGNFFNPHFGLKKLLPQSKCYDSIYTLNIGTWLKIHETQNLSLLIISGKPANEDLGSTWNKIYDEYLKEFGVSESFKEYLETKRMLIYAICDHALEPSSINETYLKIAQIDYETFFDNKEKGNFGKTHNAIQRFQGYAMPLNSTTVYDFYNAARGLQDEYNSKRNLHEKPE